MEKKMLVVDDELPIRNLMADVFSRSGYLVRTAESAEEALSIIEREKYFLFLLDLNLPGMNGIELCRRIRADNPMAIAYAITGYGNIFEIFGCREAGFEDYFTKPAKLEVLINAANHGFEKLERWQTR
jgi:CheY-like chemotaxis protein